MIEQPESLETRIEKRADTLAASVKDIAGQMKGEGFSEKAIAAYFEALEELVYKMKSVHLSDPKEQENFVLEIADAVKTITGGLTMGDGEQRSTDQYIIATHRGELTDKIRQALQEATGGSHDIRSDTTTIGEGIV